MLSVYKVAIHRPLESVKDCFSREMHEEGHEYHLRVYTGAVRKQRCHGDSGVARDNEWMALTPPGSMVARP